MIIRLRVEIDEDDRRAIALAYNRKPSYQDCKTVLLGAIDGELQYCYDEIDRLERRAEEREEQSYN